MLEVIGFALLMAGQVLATPQGWVLVLAWAVLLAVARSCAGEYETRRFLRWSAAVVVVGAVLAVVVGGRRDAHLWLPWGAALLAMQIALLAWLVSRGATFARMLALGGVLWLVTLPVFAMGAIFVLCSATNCS
jgi:hypothetical protein